MANKDHIYAAINNERHDQDRQWGTIPRGLSLPKWTAILTEEVGEVARAVIDDQPLKELRQELVEVAAVAVAIIEEIEHIRE